MSHNLLLVRKWVRLNRVGCNSVSPMCKSLPKSSSFVNSSSLHMSHRGCRLQQRFAGGGGHCIRQLGQTKHPKPSGCFGGSPFKKREATGRCLTFCLFVCPVQFVYVQLKSGSELVLGVRSEPKTRLSLSVTLCVHCSVQFVFTELQSGSNVLLGGYIRNRNITSNF